MDKETSARLAAAAKTGDNAAFAALYEGCYKSLFKAAYYILGNRHDAEDVVMDTVADAYVGIGKLRADDAFEGWIFRILYNKARRRRGTLLYTATAELTEALESPGLDKEMAAERADLTAALFALSPQERTIVVLATVCGYSSAEVARITGLNANTVRSKQMRALAKLRKTLGSKGGEDNAYGG